MTPPQQIGKTPRTKPDDLSDPKTAKTNPPTKKYATHQQLSTQAAREAHTAKAENFGHQSPHPDNTAHLLILTHRHPRESWAQQLRPHIPRSLRDSPLPPLPPLLPLLQLPPPPPPMPESDLGWLWQPPSAETPHEEEARQEEEEEEEDRLARRDKDP